MYSTLLSHAGIKLAVLSEYGVAQESLNGLDSYRIRDAGSLIMFSPYSSERVAKIKTLAGRRWHQQEQH